MQACLWTKPPKTPCRTQSRRTLKLLNDGAVTTSLGMRLQQFCTSTPNDCSWFGEDEWIPIQVSKHADCEEFVMGHGDQKCLWFWRFWWGILAVFFAEARTVLACTTARCSLNPFGDPRSQSQDDKHLAYSFWDIIEAVFIIMIIILHVCAFIHTPTWAVPKGNAGWNGSFCQELVV